MNNDEDIWVRELVARVEENNQHTPRDSAQTYFYKAFRIARNTPGAATSLPRAPAPQAEADFRLALREWAAFRR